MINIKDCKIKMIVDSREKVFNHITSEWDKNKIEYHIFKKEDSMKVGDYSIAVKTDLRSITTLSLKSITFPVSVLTAIE